MSLKQFKPLRPRTVLGIAAHPDDLDVMAAGTMARFAKAGASIHYLILTDGSSGSDDREMPPKRLTRIREAEQRAAVKAVGDKDTTFLRYPDGRLEVTMDIKRAVS